MDNYIKGHFSGTELSKYRTEIMGVATILIFLVHSSSWLPWPRSMQQLVSYGGVGVAIFAFLSGVGCYHSLYKKSSVVSFYSRRAKRILFPYIIIAGIGFFVLDVCIEKNLAEYLSDVTLWSYLTKGEADIWYMGFCVVAYILAPLIFLLKKRHSTKILSICAIIATLVLGFSLNSIWYDWFHTILLQLIVFCVGMYYAPQIMCGGGYRETIIMLIGILAGFTLKVVLPYENALLDSLFYTLLGIPLSIFSGIACHYMPNQINRVLSFFGRISFEVYLVNHFLQEIFKYFWGRTTVGYICILIMGTVLSCYILKLEKMILKR